MLKLREMQLKQQQAKAAEAAANSAPSSSPSPSGETNGTKDGTLLMHRGTSKENMVEIRKQKSRDNVFSLKTKQSGESAAKRANAAELRAQKGMSSSFFHSLFYYVFSWIDGYFQKLSSDLNIERMNFT